jgi:GNAT superfamily N-acetyltransferase
MPLDTDVTVSADPALLDVDRIAGWLAGSYWARDRDRATVERSLAGSLNWGAYLCGSQVGLTRAVTDRATFAWLCDVVVDEAWRGHGIGHRMVGAVVEELRAMGVPRIVLTTRDAHRVYADLGFSALRVPATWMEIDTRATRPDPQDVRP